MSRVFIHLLNVSITASWIVLAVVLLRLVLKKAPKWISCVLWSLVALRLLIPVHIQSPLSLIPSPEVIPQNITTTPTPAIYSSIPVVNSTVNPVLEAHAPAGGGVLEELLHIASVAWIIGMAVILLYGLICTLLLRRQVRASIKLCKGIYACDDVGSPFILGTLFPKIYVPSGLDEAQLVYVLAHENAHLKRKDHWWKPLSFVLLSVYWFNPLMWLAYILLSRDIERACDEKVITGMDKSGKKGYSEALVACGVRRRMIMVCPVAFGEVSVKARIKGVLSYKKPAFWVVTASVATCAVVAVCFLTDPLPCKHAFESKVLTASTCTREGERHYTCNKCGYSYTEAIGLLSHSLGEKTVSRESTCAEAGVLSAQCTICGQSCVVEHSAKTNDHHLVETVVRPATCDQEGEGTRTCSYCGYSEKCTYAKLEHSFKLESTYLSSCTVSGYNKMVCSGCGEVNRVGLPLSEEHHYFKDPVNGEYCCLNCGKHRPSTGSSNKKDITKLPSIPKVPKIPAGL